MSTRSGQDRRADWGPRCESHEMMDRTVTRLDASLYWIKVFCGGIFALALTAASIGLPMVYQMNKAMHAVMEDHGTRLTKVEGWQSMREKIYPTRPMP